MRILHTMLRVGDLDRSLAFYTEVLGMRQLRRQDYPEGRFTLAFVGFALLGYFNRYPELLPADIDLKSNADRVFPHFIAFHLPPGISGLVVAAMFAAAMSSIDSGVNSITAVVVTDLLPVLNARRSSPDSAAATVLNDTAGSPYKVGTSAGQQIADDHRQQMSTARWLAFAIGAIVVVASSGMGAIPGRQADAQPESLIRSGEGRLAETQLCSSILVAR